MYANQPSDDDAPEVSLIIPAAGDSTRMKSATRKPWLTLGGEPILYRTLAAFRPIKWITEIILVVNPADEDEARGDRWDELSDLGVTMVVAGGENRAQSVWNALQVSDPGCGVVAVHDAVRPFISVDTCRALFRTAQDRGAAIPVVPTQDTLKRIEGDRVTETVSRIGVMCVQTPQCFRRDLLIDAYEFQMKTGKFSADITDDSSLVEKYGHPVTVILGGSSNLKITTREDLLIAEAMLKSGLL